MFNVALCVESDRPSQHSARGLLHPSSPIRATLTPAAGRTCSSVQLCGESERNWWALSSVQPQINTRWQTQQTDRRVFVWGFDDLSHKGAYIWERPLISTYNTWINSNKLSKTFPQLWWLWDFILQTPTTTSSLWVWLWQLQFVKAAGHNNNKNKLFLWPSPSASHAEKWETRLQPGGPLNLHGCIAP